MPKEDKKHHVVNVTLSDEERDNLDLCVEELSRIYPWFRSTKQDAIRFLINKAVKSMNLDNKNVDKKSEHNE